jgi:O-antigen/teichoic acid export membrane protein
VKIPVNKLIPLLKKQKSKQVISLYTSMILGLFAGIAVSVISTRFLKPEVYGDLKFIQNVCSFLITFLTFGIFYSGSRLIAQTKNEKNKHNIIGAVTISAVSITVLFMIILFGGSFIQEKFFNNQLGYIFRIFLPLLFVYPFELFCENMLAGDNRIYNLSLFRLGPKVLYFGLLYFYHFHIKPLTLEAAFGFYLVSMTFFISYAVYRLKPKFDNVKRNLTILWHENKIYGFPVFTGALAGVASTQLGGISISFFIDNTHVGFFALAITATMPLTLIPSTVGTTFFKEFANMPYIPKRVTYLTIALSVLALVFFMVLIKEIVILLYTKEYLAVVPLAYIIAIGSALQGFGDFINRFLSAHGLGKELRNSSFAIGIFNIIGYTVLVYFFGVIGAAITKVIAGLVYSLMMYKSYKQFTRNV